MLSWTPDQKVIAKNEKKALVKLQVQLKHCGGGNYSTVGPMSRDRALAMFKLSCMNNDDPMVDKVLDALNIRRED